jgi:hypothetical protein
MSKFIEEIISKVVCFVMYYFDFSPQWIQQLFRRLASGVFSILYFFRKFIRKTKLPLSLAWVNVNDVEFISNSTLNHDILSKYIYHGVVLSGGWDLEKSLILEDELYKFTVEIFKKKSPFRETNYYKKVVNGELERYIKNKKHLDYRIHKYISLYKKIKSEGYKSQDNMSNGNIYDEVCLTIDRNGQYILEDGRHRFFIAKILGIKKIPAIINKIHSIHYNNHIRILEY